MKMRRQTIAIRHSNPESKGTILRRVPFEDRSVRPRRQRRRSVPPGDVLAREQRVVIALRPAAHVQRADDHRHRNIQSEARHRCPPLKYSIYYLSKSVKDMPQTRFTEASE